MTPRQIAGYLRLGAKRKRLEAAQQLQLQAVATQSSEKHINSSIKSLLKD